MSKHSFDFAILGMLLGIIFILFSMELGLIGIERDIKEIKEYLEPTLPNWNDQSLE